MSPTAARHLPWAELVHVGNVSFVLGSILFVMDSRTMPAADAKHPQAVGQPQTSQEL